MILSKQYLEHLSFKFLLTALYAITKTFNREAQIPRLIKLNSMWYTWIACVYSKSLRSAFLKMILQKRFKKILNLLLIWKWIQLILYALMTLSKTSQTLLIWAVQFEMLIFQSEYEYKRMANNQNLWVNSKIFAFRISVAGRFFCLFNRSTRTFLFKKPNKFFQRWTKFCEKTHFFLFAALPLGKSLIRGANKWNSLEFWKPGLNPDDSLEILRVHKNLRHSEPCLFQKKSDGKIPREVFCKRSVQIYRKSSRLWADLKNFLPSFQKSPLKKNWWNFF